MSGVDQAHLFTPPVPITLSLRDRFLVPPFSVLDTRAGYWQERKQAWLGLGIEGELGRDTGMAFNTETWAYQRDCRMCGKRLVVQEVICGTCGAVNDAQRDADAAYGGKGTSVFDPVICELSYRWFSPAGGLVVDPFAGGSVRGVVAAGLGRRYRGTDLSLPQVEANYQQVPPIKRALADGWQQDPVWIHADARDLLTHVDPGTADLIFTCPPYYDLEVYSDHVDDLSAAPTYGAFLAGYRQCIAAAAKALHMDRFAVIVVGEVRDKQGYYVGLVPDTIRAFADVGLALYNESILVTAVGSLPIRTSKMFVPSRKIGKTHQNVLCFVKGSWKAAAEACEVPAEVAIEYGGATLRIDGDDG